MVTKSKIPPNPELEKELDAFHQMRVDAEQVAVARDRLMASVVPAEVQKKIDEIDSEFGPKIAGAKLALEQHEITLKQSLLAGCKGFSVRGAYLMGVYSKPRIKWNTAQLDDYVIEHPEVLTQIGAFRVKGDPSISLRPVKSAE